MVSFEGQWVSWWFRNPLIGLKPNVEVNRNKNHISALKLRYNYTCFIIGYSASMKTLKLWYDYTFWVVFINGHSVAIKIVQPHKLFSCFFFSLNLINLVKDRLNLPLTFSLSCSFPKDFSSNFCLKKSSSVFYVPHKLGWMKSPKLICTPSDVTESSVTCKMPNISYFISINKVYFP